MYKYYEYYTALYKPYITRTLGGERILLYYYSRTPILLYCYCIFVIWEDCDPPVSFEKGASFLKWVFP